MVTYRSGWRRRQKLSVSLPSVIDAVTSVANYTRGVKMGYFRGLNLIKTSSCWSQRPGLINR